MKLTLMFDILPQIKEEREVIFFKKNSSTGFYIITKFVSVGQINDLIDFVQTLPSSRQLWEVEVLLGYLRKKPAGAEKYKREWKAS